MSTVIALAEKRLADSINARNSKDITYWAAYLDGARAVQKEVEHAAS